MKSNLIIASALSLWIGAPVNAAQSCDTLVGCDEKLCQLQQELESAEKHNNTAKQKNLMIAIDKVKTYCSLDKLKADLQDDIEDVNEDLAEHQEDLQEAQAEQKADKIEKYQQKISEDQNKLKSLHAELDKLNQAG